MDSTPSTAKWRAREDPIAAWLHPCFRVVPAELAVTYEEPETAEPAKLALPCQGPVARPRAYGAQRTVASPQVRPLPARRAQDLDARVGSNVPEEPKLLKAKPDRDCDNHVEDGNCLWTALENAGKFLAPVRRRIYACDGGEK